jgi:hypothetical protein
LIARRRSILNSIANRTGSGKKDAKNFGTTIQRIDETHEEGDEEEEEENSNNTDLQQKALEESAWLTGLISELQDVISHRHMEEVRNNRELKTVIFSGS